ncbi:hypothetical protein PSQ90_00960 [Devosia rhodophyticola]|uniref:Uncharacterized protein n=1 Tax=Devosia rhodophyticola TaxID=3026423 RepID=A0ABY7YXU2_9HYPH|nr:hypothetical protein [Devosia rhodophyticola]WDR06064.1 hypothetical protein PSQ90_00960 [Devosia rhodophyticola]
MNNADNILATQRVVAGDVGFGLTCRVLPEPPSLMLVSLSAKGLSLQTTVKVVDL